MYQTGSPVVLSLNQYDPMGRMQVVDTIINGTTYHTSMDFDFLGFPVWQRLASEYGLKFDLLWSVSGPGANGDYFGTATFGYRLAPVGPSEGCGWHLVCDFYIGVAETALGGNPLNLLKTAGAAAAPIAAVAVGAAAWAYIPPAIRLAPEIPGLARGLARSVFTNPAAREALEQFFAALNPATAPPATWWGLGVFAAGEIYQSWNNWL